jgi:hypothetical protein
MDMAFDCFSIDTLPPLLRSKSMVTWVVAAWIQMATPCVWSWFLFTCITGTSCKRTMRHCVERTDMSLMAWRAEYLKYVTDIWKIHYFVVLCFDVSGMIVTISPASWAAVGMAWSLRSSTGNGQAAVYFLQKHSLCLKYISLSHWNLVTFLFMVKQYKNSSYPETERNALLRNVGNFSTVETA